MRRPRAHIKRPDPPKSPLFSIPVGRLSKRTTRMPFALSYRCIAKAPDVSRPDTGRRLNFIGAREEHLF